MYADREEEALARRQRARQRRDDRSVSPVSPVSRRSYSPSRSPPPSRSYRSRRPSSPDDAGLTRERELQEQLRRRALRSRRRDGEDVERSRKEDDGDHQIIASLEDDRRFRRRGNEDVIRKRRSSPSSRDGRGAGDGYSYGDSPISSTGSRRRSSHYRRDSRASSITSDDYRRSRRHSPPPRDQYYDRPRYRHFDRYGPPPARYSPPRYNDRRRPEQRDRAPRSPLADDYEIRSIFCSQLAARLTQRDLGEFFEEKLGEGVVLDVRIVMDRLTGRSKGVGYVELSDEALVGQAIGLSGTSLFGIPIIVQKSDAARNGVTTTTSSNSQAIHIDPSNVPSAASRLYVGNLHFSLSEADVRSIFEPFGAIMAIDLHREPSSQKSKGFAFVQFVNSDVAEKAIEHMNGFELAGRNIKVGHVNAAMTSKASAGNNDERMGGAGAFSNKAAVAAMEAAGATATLTSSFDEGGGGGLTASGRVALMEMLARSDSKQADRSSIAPEQQRPSSIPQSVSRGVLLKNMFKAEEESERDWDKDLADDVREECEAKYGKVDSIKVDMDSTSGEIWIRFMDVKGAQKAVDGLNGRFFGGRSISAIFVSEGFLASVLD